MNVFVGETMLNGKDKDAAAVSMGSRGGKARAALLSAKRRKEIARNAARQRWNNYRKNHHKDL